MELPEAGCTPQFIIQHSCSHSNQGQFESHQLASRLLSPRGRRTASTRRWTPARRACKCCAARLNPSPDVLAVRLTAAPLCHAGTRAAQLYHFTHTVFAASKKSTGGKIKAQFSLMWPRPLCHSVHVIRLLVESLTLEPLDSIFVVSLIFVSICCFFNVRKTILSPKTVYISSRKRSWCE